MAQEQDEDRKSEQKNNTTHMLYVYRKTCVENEGLPKRCARLENREISCVSALLFAYK